MKDDLKTILVKKLNRELVMAEKNGDNLNPGPRFVNAKVNPVKGLFINIDKLILQVDDETDFRIEVEDISIGLGGDVTVTYRLNDFFDNLRDEHEAII